MVNRVGILIMALALVACSKDEYFGPVYENQPDTAVSDTAYRLFVGCEGNFQIGNASLSVIDLNAEVIQNGAFEAANGFGVGDVLQSMYLHGDSLFLVVNNSGVIRILNRQSLQQTATIEGITSPRHVHVVNRHFLIVTDLYSDQLVVYDLRTLSQHKTLPLEGWTEHLTEGHGHVLISNIDEREVHLFNPQTLEVDHTEQLFMQPHHSFATEEGFLVVGARSDEDSKGVIKQLGSDGSIVDSTVLSSPVLGVAMHGQVLYVLTSKEVRTYGYPALTQSGKFTHGLETPYAMVVDPAGESLFITDAKDYLSVGHVHQYSIDGSLLQRYTANIIPQAMLFDL